jgi:hypothetical protein
MSGQSPLKIKPLRLPGESVDDEIVHLRENGLIDGLSGSGDDGKQRIRHRCPRPGNSG